jgi:eukaryotic-like serine/threonine-protein kinase
MTRFKYAEHLGSGAFGSVYECWEEDETGEVIQEDLAIKLLKEEWLDNEEVRHRFRREARFGRDLKHPGILPILYSNLSAERPYLVSPLASGSLTDALKENRAADRDWVLELFGALLEAMAHAHQREVLHRDLKPDNVLFVDDRPVISDFGMGKELAGLPSGPTLTNHPVGTMLYMAPEQWTDARTASYPADVYSLGKMLWELLVNRPPRPWAPELEYIDDEKLRGFIERCCEDEPSLRYRDAGDALRAWEVLMGELPPVRAPLDRAQALIEEWGRTKRGPDIKVVRRLDALLVQHRAEEQLYYEIVPLLPDQLVAQYCEKLPRQFAAMLNTYIEHIGGDLPFNYCDSVARFYAHVFGVSPDDEVRRLVLAELLKLGPRHNRYPVADIVRELLWSLEDDVKTAFVAGVIAKTPEAAWYYHRQTLKGPLPPLIEDALATADAEDEPDEDLVF